MQFEESDPELQPSLKADKAVKIKKNFEQAKKAAQSHLVDVVNKAHETSTYIASHNPVAKEGFGLLSEASSSSVSESRRKIVRITNLLNTTSSIMVVYSLVYLLMKAIDYSQQGTRLQTYRESSQFKIEHDKFPTLYYEVNFLSLLMAVLVVAATVYLKFAVASSKVFSPMIYKKFMLICCSVLVLYTGLLMYFVYHLFNFSEMNLLTLLGGLKAISYLASDSTFRNVTETVCSMLMFAGLVAMMLLSSLVEEEVRRLDELRNQSNLDHAYAIS